MRRRKRHVCLVLCNTRLSGKVRHAPGQHELNERTLEELVEHRLNGLETAHLKDNLELN